MGGLGRFGGCRPSLLPFVDPSALSSSVFTEDLATARYSLEHLIENQLHRDGRQRFEVRSTGGLEVVATESYRRHQDGEQTLRIMIDEIKKFDQMVRERSGKQVQADDRPNVDAIKKSISVLEVGMDSFGGKGIVFTMIWGILVSGCSLYFFRSLGWRPIFPSFFSPMLSKEECGCSANLGFNHVSPSRWTKCQAAQHFHGLMFKGSAVHP